ncbi:MAG TPA: Hsp33 family molecular chaperone HslO [Rhodanobacteraceae bacterium]|nr:Hsp33 family molecular chaperone HslO [Rhodanobacteraceae bacterium]
MDNLRQRFFFPDTDLRGEYVRLESALSPVLHARDYPLEIQSQLAEALVAACLMAGTLKFDGRLALQAQGQGELSLLLAEATHDNTVRGLAQWKRPVAQIALPDLASLLGDQAMMAITLKPQQGKDYQSLVPLASSDLAACLGDYFDQSEQLPTHIRLAFGNGRATGLLLQRMPDQHADRQTNDDRWQTLEALAGTLTTEELLDLPIETILYRLFHETPPQLAEPVELRFACTCSRDRAEAMLLSLGHADLQAMLDEQGETDVRCDFCRQNQHFDADQLKALVQSAASK